MFAPGATPNGSAWSPLCVWQWATLGLSLTRLLIAVTGGTLQRNGAGFSRVLILALGAGGRASAMGKPQSSGG